MNPKIIAERDNSLILFEAGKVKTVPNTLYNQVKYRDYKGERIFYTFSDGVYVKETFDDGIFNAFMNVKIAAFIAADHNFALAWTALPFDWRHDWRR